MTKVSEWDWSLHQTINWIHTEKEYGYDEGAVITPDGIVHTYAQGDEGNDYFTILRFSIGGRIYIRRFDKRFTRRGMARKAREFATEMTGDQP